MTKHNSRPEPEAVLAVGSFLLFAGIAVLVLLKIVPAENEKYAMLMLGALIGIVKDTFGRYFQATKGAQEQRREAADVARTLAETASVVATAAATTVAPPTEPEAEPQPDPAMFQGPRQ